MRNFAILLLLTLSTPAFAKKAELEGAQAIALYRILQKFDVGAFSADRFALGLTSISCTGPNDPDAHLNVQITCILSGFHALDKSHSKTISNLDKKSPEDAVSIFTILKSAANGVPEKRPSRVRSIVVRKVHCAGLTSTETSTKCDFDY